MGKYFTNDPAEVSARMRLIRGKNTKAELALFSILSAAQIPFEQHVRIGRIEADAAVNGRILVFVDSPFWHLRSEEELGRLSPYWQQRLLGNRNRDERQRRKLRKLGYFVLRLWADEIDEQRVLRRIQHIISKMRPLKART